MESQQYSCLNKTGTISTPVGMAMWTGEFHMVPLLAGESQVSMTAGRQRIRFLQGQAPT